MKCYLCGKEGHRRRECPERAPVPARAPGLPPAPVMRVPSRRQLAEVADAHAWANLIRATDSRMGSNTCGNPDDVVNTPFRRIAGLGSAHECALRQLAARQLAEKEPA